VTVPEHDLLSLYLLWLYNSHGRKQAAFGDLNLANLKMMFSSFIHLPANNKILVFLAE
jgi:hypothetical protein